MLPFDHTHRQTSSPITTRQLFKEKVDDPHRLKHTYFLPLSFYTRTKFPYDASLSISPSLFLPSSSSPGSSSSSCCC